MAAGAKKKRRAKRSFSEEYKAGAVRLVLDEGKTAAEMARNLDLTSSTVRTWVERARADQGTGKPAFQRLHSSTRSTEVSSRLFVRMHHRASLPVSWRHDVATTG